MKGQLLMSIEIDENVKKDFQLKKIKMEEEQYKEIECMVEEKFTFACWLNFWCNVFIDKKIKVKVKWQNKELVVFEGVVEKNFLLLNKVLLLSEVFEINWNGFEKKGLFK